MIKKTKNILNIIFVLTIFNIFLGIGIEPVYAINDPFQSATEKTNEAVEYLTGDFAIAVSTLIIVVAGMLLMFGKLRMEWAIKIMGGAIIVGAAAAIADWLMG